MKRISSNFKTAPMLKASVLGIAVSWGITLLLALMMAIFIQNEYIDIISIPVITVGVTFFSAFAGSFLGGQVSENRKNVVCAIVGMTYYLSQLCIAMLFFDGLKLSSLISLAACLLGGILAMIACNTKKKGKKQHGRKVRSR